jgi:hypothetical protein
LGFWGFISGSIFLVFLTAKTTKSRWEWENRQGESFVSPQLSTFFVKGFWHGYMDLFKKELPLKKHHKRK